jgi:hypothetical protein
MDFIKEISDMFVKFKCQLPKQLFNLAGYNNIIDEGIKNHFYLRPIDVTDLSTPVTKTARQLLRERKFEVGRLKRSVFVNIIPENGCKREELGIIQVTCHDGFYYHHFKDEGDNVVYTLEINASKGDVIQDQPWFIFLANDTHSWKPEYNLLDKTIPNLLKTENGLFPEPWTYKSKQTLNLEFDYWKNSILFDQRRGLIEITDYAAKTDENQKWHEDFVTYLRRTGKIRGWAHNEIRGYQVCQLESILVNSDLANPNSAYKGQPTVLQELINEMVSPSTRQELKLVLDKFLSEIHTLHEAKESK